MICQRQNFTNLLIYKVMDKKKIDKIVYGVIGEYCATNSLNIELTKDTPLIGGSKIMDSMGLVNTIVDIETAFLDEEVEISLTSESAMSGRVSPFRSIGALCNFIARQLDVEED